jgi:hypothetical protein
MKQIQNTLSFTKAAFLLVFVLYSQFLFAQKNPKPLTPVDTIPVTTKISAEKKIDATKEIKKDTTVKKHSPKIAATRSAIFPGLGQIYNKKYWKLPIVYGAMGVSTYIFVDNIKTYKEYRFAYNARYKASLPAPRTDSADYFKLDNIYKIIQPESIRAARNKFRQYVDYSVLFFILMWGLNVVDATVDAHLQSFDVSPNLSLSIEPGRSQLAGTNGISLVLHIGKK